MSRLVLGTAQFGSAYGITNSVGRLSDAAVAELISVARASEVDTFDTAADYGDSQDRLGALAPQGNRYITKFSLPAEGPVDAQALFAASADVLGVGVLAGVMFHKVPDLSGPRAADAIAVLRAGRDAGAIERIGVSIYDADDLDLAIRVFPDLTLLQVPGNLLDRRLLDDPRIAALREAGVEIHVRSAFLQGILLSDPASLPAFFAPLTPILRDLHARAADEGTTVLGLALRYLRDHELVDGVVVGATTPGELGGILHAWAEPGTLDVALPTGLPTEVLDPRKWPR